MTLSLTLLSVPLRHRGSVKFLLMSDIGIEWKYFKPNNCVQTNDNWRIKKGPWKNEKLRWKYRYNYKHLLMNEILA